MWNSIVLLRRVSAVALAFGVGCLFLPATESLGDEGILNLEENGVEVAIDEAIGDAASIMTIAQDYNRELESLIMRERMVDILDNEMMLWEVHDLVGSYSGGRPPPDVEYSEFDLVRKKFEEHRYGFLIFRLNRVLVKDYGNALDLVKNGGSLQGISYDEETDSLVSKMDPGGKAWQHEAVFILKAPKYGLERVQADLDLVLKSVDEFLDFRSHAIALKYIHEQAMKLSKSSFVGVDPKEQWFHSGLSGLLTYYVARHYLGEDEANDIWGKMYFNGPVRRVSEKTLFNWDVSQSSPGDLGFLSQRIFFGLEQKQGYESMQAYLSLIDENADALLEGSTTARVLLEEHIGGAVATLLN